jgi:NAD-dependent deacetylase
MAPSRRRKPKSSRSSDDENTDTNTATDTTTAIDTHDPYPKRRKSSRGKRSLSELARDIVVDRKRVVVITGAGVSVASGVRPFRGSSGVWKQVIWTTATREAFRKNPLDWYNQFWLPFLSLPTNPQPNAGHLALEQLLLDHANVNMITQNVDGLHTPSSRLIEAHGRLGLYKCLPNEDSDTDSDSDDDDERDVHLGHRRKSKLRTTSETSTMSTTNAKHKQQKQEPQRCRFQTSQSLTIAQVEPPTIRDALQVTHGTCPKGRGKRRLATAPKCPSCGNFVAPQALLFDEGYHSHDFYQFQTVEDWIASADVLVFVGTSFAVTLTEVALEHARAKSLPVYNFNTQDFLESTVRLDVANISGPSQETLPELLQACQQLSGTTTVTTTTTTAIPNTKKQVQLPPSPTTSTTSNNRIRLKS